MTDASLLPTVHASLLAARTQIDNAIAAIDGTAKSGEPQPGAWFVHWNGNYWDITVGESPYDPSIAAVWSGDRARHSSEATAWLVAAARDLYEAIRNSDDAHWTPAMRAAMAKAEGQS